MKNQRHLLISTLAAILFLALSLGTVQAGPCELPEFNADDFDEPVDNRYLPQSVIGKTYVYEAEDEDGMIIDYIEFTKKTKDILGVKCTIVYDVEFLELEDEDTGVITYVKLEETWDWYAWDNYGNFWYFGEDTTEYEYDDDWELTGCSDEGTWEAGQDVAEIGSDADPGIILPAHPLPGDCYNQEYYEDEAEDVGMVLKNNAICEDLDGNESYECMVMKEWTPLEPGNVEHKIYYPGLGLVQVKELKEKTVEVELVEIYKGHAPKNLDNPTCP